MSNKSAITLLLLLSLLLFSVVKNSICVALELSEDYLLADLFFSVFICATYGKRRAPMTATQSDSSERENNSRANSACFQRLDSCLAIAPEAAEKSPRRFCDGAGT